MNSVLRQSDSRAMRLLPSRPHDQMGRTTAKIAEKTQSARDRNPREFWQLGLPRLKFLQNPGVPIELRRQPAVPATAGHRHAGQEMRARHRPRAGR